MQNVLPKLGVFGAGVYGLVGFAGLINIGLLVELFERV